MIPFRHRMIGAGLAALEHVPLHRVSGSSLRGRGAILTFHHVRPWAASTFAPHRLLEIEPAFLERLLQSLRRSGTCIVSLDDVPALLCDPASEPFVALTFDDGYRDNLEIALPILEKYDAPFTLFATTGFLDRTAPLWWIDLATAVGRLDQVAIEVGGVQVRRRAKTAAEKGRAFAALLRELERVDDLTRLAVVKILAEQSGVDSRATLDRLCMSWSELDHLAAHPLAAVGCHTLTHPRLSRVSRDEAARELTVSRTRLEERLGVNVRHLAYPYGYTGAAGSREFTLARDLGFETAVTTRPGVLFPEHAAHLTALPRVSMNGLWQRVEAVEVLLSGLPFALWNKGRRLNVT